MKKSLSCRDKHGERGGTRTLDPMIKSYEFLVAGNFEPFRIPQPSAGTPEK
jgi:hypothetical protein